MTPPRREFRWKSRLYFRHKNVAVITTRFILSGQENITRVYHHFEDGMWEFVGEEDANDSDYLVISLGEIVQHDSSIQDVVDIEPGYSAHRVGLGREWQIKKEELF